MPETFLSIDALLERMVARNASDLHITVGTPPAMRVHGVLERYEDVPDLSPEDTHQLLYRVLSTEQQKLLEINRQIDFAHSIPGLARFRVNVFFQRGTLGAAFIRAGHKLTFVDREAAHVEAINDKGLTIAGPIFQDTVRFVRAQFDLLHVNVASVMPPDGYTSICQCKLCEGKDSPERDNLRPVVFAAGHGLNQAGYHTQATKRHPDWTVPQAARRGLATGRDPKRRPNRRTEQEAI